MSERSAEHVAAHQWLYAALGGTEAVAFAWTVVLPLSGSVRTRRCPRTPLTAGRSAEVIQPWLDAPPAMLVEPQWPAPSAAPRAVERAGRAGNLVGDAHLAALALER